MSNIVMSESVLGLLRFYLGLRCIARQLQNEKISHGRELTSAYTIGGAGAEGRGCLKFAVRPTADQAVLLYTRATAL